MDPNLNETDNGSDTVWRSTAVLLRTQFTDAVWLSTFNDVRPIALDGHELTVAVPSNQVRDKILTRYMPLIGDALEEASGWSDARLNILVDPSAVALDRDDVVETMPRADSPPVPLADGAAPTRSSTRDDVGLNPRYMFETFVKGSSNAFALAAALRVAETPGRVYNPLFIHGAAGLGKTHLLQAIGHYVHDNYQHHEVRYVSTENFLNEFVDAIRYKSNNAFQRRYREVDVLIIDDIQFMESREGLQEEFFHTFNALHGTNKQIVISSDRLPDEIPTLEERLVGRFKWGLVTDIQLPDVETRMAILHNKAERDGSQVPPDVLEFIATRISSNIRELEGALTRATAYASLSGETLTVDLTQHLLHDLIREGSMRPRTDEELLAEIAELLGFEVEALKGKSRQRPLVTARQIAMYVFRNMTELSFPAIAKLFGGRDHTTVMHAVDKIGKLMGERKQVYDQVTQLLRHLQT